MDKETLKIYIKMCEKAIEVQKLHKPTVCDLYVCSCNACKERVTTPYYIQDYDMDYLNKRDLTNVEPNYAKMVKSADVCTFVAFYHGRCDEDLSYIWLPRQEDLQKMVKENLGELIQGFYDFNYDSGFVWLSDAKFTSMEQLWLAFVMKEKFNKTWNGEEWILQNQS